MPSEERRSAISSQRGAPKRDQHAERGAPERDQLAARSDKARSTRVEMAGAAPHTRVSSDGGGPHQLKDEERSGNANSSATMHFGKSNVGGAHCALSEARKEAKQN